MGSSYVDRDDTVVKGDDGTSDGAKITVTTDGAKKRLDTTSFITNTASNPVPVSAKGDLMTGYQPDPSDAVDVVDGAKFQFDASNRLEMHGSTTSDEGGDSDDFAGSSFLPDWTATNSGTGSSTSVASGRASLLSGTTNGGVAQIIRSGDYGPMTLHGWGKITQRIANQTATFGFMDSSTSPTKQAVVIFEGTTNTAVKFRTAFGSAATEIQETTVSIPSGGNTSTDHYYKIDVSCNRCALLIDGIVVAKHDLHIPGQYDAMNIVARISNAATVTATTFSFDKIQFNNWDRTQVDLDFGAEPLLTQNYIDPALTTVSSVTRTEISQAAFNGNAFTFIVTNLNANTAETRLIYLVNSSANSKTIYLANLLMAVDASSSNWCNFQIYYNPTVTANGTALTIRNLRAGSATATAMNAYSSPTVTSNGTGPVFYFPYNNSNQSGAVVPYNANPYIIIPPANSLLLTGIAKSNSTPTTINFNWFEV